MFRPGIRRSVLLATIVQTSSSQQANPSKEAAMSIQKKSLKSSSSKSGKAAQPAAKKAPAKAVSAAAKSVSLKTVHYPPDPC
jgi:hypothetical protein